MAPRKKVLNYDTLRDTLQPIIFKDYKDITLFGPASVVLDAECGCLEYLYLQSEPRKGNGQLEFIGNCRLRHYQHLRSEVKDTCVKDKVMYRTTGKGYIIPFIGNRTPFCNITAMTPPHYEYENWMTVLAEHASGRTDILILELETSPKQLHLKTHFSIAYVYHSQGMAIPLSLCFPEKLPLELEEKQHRLDDREIRKIIRAMQTSIKYAKAQHKTMLDYLTTVGSHSRPDEPAEMPVPPTTS